MRTILAVAVGAGRTKRPYIPGLVDGLERLGQKLDVDYKIVYMEAEPESLKKVIATALKESKPEVIFPMSTTAVEAAMTLSKDVPIVFPSISDPLADKFIRSYARPGKNATGVRALRTQTSPDCLELFKATVPSLQKVFGLYHERYDPATRAFPGLRQAAKRARVVFKPLPVKQRGQIVPTLEKLAQTGPPGEARVGVLVLPDDVMLSAWDLIIGTAQDKRRIPTFFPITDWVKGNPPSALGGFGVPQRACGEATAPYVHQIFGGVSPGDLPVRIVGRFEWAINRSVAAQLKIEVPDHVLGVADRVI